MFNKQVEVLKEENKIIITVSTEARRFISEKRVTFQEDILSLIPEEYANKITLVSKPEHYIANFQSKTYNNTGTWVYEILQEKAPPAPKKTQRTRRRRKTVNKESSDNNDSKQQ